MNRKLLAGGVIAAVIALAAIASRTLVGGPTTNAVQLNQIMTDSVRVFGEMKFIGCPNLMYRVQEPTPTIAVETLWNDTMEEINSKLDEKNTFRRDQLAINWHGNFAKPDAEWIKTLRSKYEPGPSIMW